MSRKRELFAEFTGEMGWELFCFQGVLRRIAKNYDRVVVASRQGHDLLYSDFFSKFVPLNNVGSETSGARCLDYKYDNLHEKYVGKNADVIEPGQALARYSPSNPQLWRKVKQDFISYGQEMKTYIDFLIHPRMTDKCGSGERNWSREKWDILVGRLKQAFPELVIATVGTSGGSYRPKQTIDLRDISLKDLANYMRSTEFIVGPSSGPIHFASLCHQKQIVWSSSRNRIKYLKDWNPFGVEVEFLEEGWDPDINLIFDRIVEHLGIDVSYDTDRA